MLVDLDVASRAARLAASSMSVGAAARITLTASV
jgi:hypothetical protein